MADLVADFKRLRLYGMAARYAEGLEQGQPAMTTATALLTQLVQAEATDRATRSGRYQMHGARFAIHRDLASFDFDQAKVDRRQITSFATTAFTEPAENIVLIGGTGTGKTPLATALGVEAVTRHNQRVRFYSTVELVTTLEQEKASGRAGRLAHQLMHLDLVILDELGYWPLSPAGGAPVPGRSRIRLTGNRSSGRQRKKLPSRHHDVSRAYNNSTGVRPGLA